VLFILARGGQTYARLQFHVGPGGSLLIPVTVDYSRPFAASDHEAWQNEYQASVIADDFWLDVPLPSAPKGGLPVADSTALSDDDWWGAWNEYLDLDLFDCDGHHTGKQEELVHDG